MISSFCYDPSFNNYAFTFKLEKNKQKFCGVVEKKYLSAAEMKNNSEDKPLSSKHEETNEFLL